MDNDGEPGNELQQGQQVVNDVDLSDAQVQLELDLLEIRLELESNRKAINDLEKKIHLAVKEAINDLEKKIHLAVKEAINGPIKTIQEMDPAKKQELECEANSKTTTSPYYEIFRERIGSHIPYYALKVIEEELTKLKRLQPNSHDYHTSFGYLDCLTSLPWETYSDGNVDVHRAKQILNEKHYGLTAVKNTILEIIAVGIQSGTFQGKIMCLCGPPGVGKTGIVRSIARALHREFFQFSVGGLSDVSVIKGHRRTYASAMPGEMVNCLRKVKRANPVVLIDEIDKLGRGHIGDLASAMLELLDPTQNDKFYDHYVDVPIDLSKVLFVCTANVVDNIPIPLLNRMEVIDICEYTTEEKISIARDYLEKDICEDFKIKPEKVEVTDEALLVLIEKYCRDAGIRNLKMLLEKIYRKITLQLLQSSKEADAMPTDLPADQPSNSKDLVNTKTIQESKATKTIEKVVVDTLNLVDFVGVPSSRLERIYSKTPIGVAMGLAWTPNGGTILYVEIAPSEEAEGKGDLILTGQLGNVMKESAQVAYTIAKLILLGKDPDNHYFANTKLHLHVPMGATPKDGPSAGCTMITAFLSLAMRKYVKEDLAITGEVTINGKILPIGEVMAKTTAAKRNGVKTIILPSANESDFNNLASKLKEGLKVHYVDDYSQILDVAFRDDEKTEK